MEQELFKDNAIFIHSRPAFVTEQQKEAFFKKNAQSIIDNGWCNDTMESIICDLKNISLQESGYEIAKSFELMGDGYDINTEFIEFLDGLYGEYNCLKRQNIIAWVKATNPQPKFKIGDMLIYKNKKVLVSGIHEETAEYIINVDPKIRGGKLIPYEKIDEVIY